MSEIAEMIALGIQCSHCGVLFKEAHGYPVLCTDCYRHESKKERAGLQRATIEEL